MTDKITAILAIPVVALAYYAGYRSAGQPATAGQAGGPMLPVSTRPGTPVATFDGLSISDAELKAQIEDQAPFVRSRYSTPEGKKEFLDNLVRFELLAREAQKKGYQNEPDVVRQSKRNMVAMFVQKEFEEPQQKAPVPEEDLRKYYEDHKSDYVRPERVRVATVFFAAPAGEPEKRKAQKAAAEAALAEIKEKDAKDYGAFAELARSRSEDPASKPMGGDLQFLSLDDLTKRVGAEVSAVAAQTKDLGKVVDQVVETAQGFHLVKMLGREAALDLKFENVKDSIKSRVLYERRSEAYKRFLEGIGAKANLKIEQAALDAVKIDPAPAMPTPGPGALPPAPRRPMPPPPAPPPAQ